MIILKLSSYYCLKFNFKKWQNIAHRLKNKTTPALSNNQDLKKNHMIHYFRVKQNSTQVTCSTAWWAPWGTALSGACVRTGRCSGGRHWDSSEPACNTTATTVASEGEVVENSGHAPRTLAQSGSETEPWGGRGTQEEGGNGIFVGQSDLLNWRAPPLFSLLPQSVIRLPASYAHQHILRQ